MLLAIVCQSSRPSLQTKLHFNIHKHPSYPTGGAVDRRVVSAICLALSDDGVTERRRMCTRMNLRQKGDVRNLR